MTHSTHLPRPSLSVGSPELSRRVAAEQRHTRRRPCPICGGGHDDPRGRGRRCYGFTSADGRYARCSREEFAGALQPERDGRHYAHRLDGPCRCGQTHANTPLAFAASPARRALSSTQRRTSHERDTSPARRVTSPRQFARYTDIPRSAGPDYPLTATYPYHDASGAVAFEVRRFDGPAPTRDTQRRQKQFRVYTPRGDGGWTEALNAPRVLYHLPDLLRAQRGPKSAPIYLCEGEKAADALRNTLAATALPSAVTTTSGGAMSGHLTPLDPLAGHRVIILPDHDSDGHRYALTIAQRARDAGALIVVSLELPGLPEKGDVVDWLAAGHTVVELVALAEDRLAEASDAPDRPLDTTPSERIAPFEPIGTLLSAVTPEQVRWFWRGYIPLGKVTTLDGDPGLGKSTLTAYLTACATTGAPLPDGSCCEPGGVVLLSAEDDAADTIRPRLDAAGADPSRVYLLQGLTTRDADGKPHERDVYLPGDLPALEAAIRRMHARLVVIDPLMAFLSSEVNSHRDQDVRGALRPLTALASQTGAAILLVRHLNKAAGGSALYRGGGSIGIIGAARSGLLVAPDPDDPESGSPNGRRALAVVKSNLGAAAPALTFRVISAPSGVGMIAWEGETHRTANDLMGQPLGEEERSLTDEAADYLRATLSEGPRPATEVQAEAPREVRGKPLRRASQRLGIERRRVGYGKGGYFEWSLPRIASASASNPSAERTPDAIDALDAHRCPPNPIDAHQEPRASMEGKGAYGANEAREGPGAGASHICPVTGGQHETARLRTADGWLLCIECEQTLPIRAEAG